LDSAFPSHANEAKDTKQKNDAHTALGGFKRSVSRFGRDFRAMFSENITLRMSLAALGAFAVSLSRVFQGGFRFYDLFAAIFSVLVAPAATLVFSVRLEEKRDNKLIYILSSGALLFALVRSANSAQIAYIPVSCILAFFLSLYCTDRFGTAYGVGAAILGGIAYRAIEVPAYLLASLVYGGVPWKRRESVGVLLACFAAAIWSAYVGASDALTRAFPAYLLGGAAFAAISRIRAEKKETAPTNEENDPETELRCVRTRHEDSNDRFRDISDAFSSLSEMFYNLSDRLRRPGALDLRRICDSSFDAYCSNCPNKTVCWGLEYSDTLTTIGHLTSALHTKGRVESEQIPEHMRQRCFSMDRILEQINTACARFTADLLKNNRNEIFAMDYEAAANIINDALEEDNGEYKFDPDMEARLLEYLDDAGISAQGVSVYGMRRRQILVRGVDMERSSVTMETLRSDLGEMCGLELGSPSFEVEKNVTSMILQAKRKLSVEGALQNLSADGGVSGDTVNLFSNRKDYFYSLICDGMGAGREAAFTSNLCSTFLEKMLRAGNRAGTSLRMLNNLILSRCSGSREECSSTIDLIELDLITGEASFIKSGAAPSFIIRDGQVRRLQAGTAPIGIIRGLETGTAKFSFRQGDTVVMVSDGITEAEGGEAWLTELLSDCERLTPEEIVERICEHAASREEHDDCSAIALRISAA
jgi:stage II sporulation protein E